MTQTPNPTPLRKHLTLFDIDGVCADDSHRVKYALTKDWPMYFDLASEDSVLWPGLELADEYNDKSDHVVQYLTGRRVDMYELTKRWLESYGFPNPEKITMRGFAHRDILAKFKAGVIKNAIEGGEFESVHIFEDDPAVVSYINSIWPGTATLVSWYVKHPEMIKEAKA